MKKVNIKDIKEGEKVETTFLVTKKETGVSKSGKPYLTLRLRDSTGEVEGRVWDNVDSLGECFRKDDVVSIKGSVIFYQGKIQINVVDIKKAAEGVSFKDYLPSSKQDPEEMMKELDGAILDIKDRHIGRLLKTIFSDAEIRRRFMLAPAAKSMHHPYLGGLLEHVVSLLRLGRFVSSHYKGINQDILMAGLILHDIGKIYELSYEKAFDYTDEGRLIGHITMGLNLIDSKIKEMADFPDNLSLLLKHILLSHHGHLEFGSPKRPKTLEAMVVYYLDDLDAKVNSIQSLIDAEGGIGNWTDYQRLFDRYIYKNLYISEGDSSNEAGKEEKGEKEFRLFK